MEIKELLELLEKEDQMVKKAHMDQRDLMEGKVSRELKESKDQQEKWEMLANQDLME